MVSWSGKMGTEVLSKSFTGMRLYLSFGDWTDNSSVGKVGVVETMRRILLLCVVLVTLV